MTDLRPLHAPLLLLPAVLLAASGCDGPGGDKGSGPGPVVTADAGAGDAFPTRPDAAPVPDGDAGAVLDGSPLADVDGGPAVDATQPPLPDGSVTTLPETTIAKQPLAGVCTTDDDCKDGYCNALYAGGYCSLQCATHTDCPEGSKCYTDPVFKDAPKMCWKLCSTASGCRLDQFCAAGAKICTPKCQPGDCNQGYECDMVGGQCVPIGATTCHPTTEVCDGADNDCDGLVDTGCGPGVADGGETTYVLDLGLVQVGGDGLSQQLSFTPSSAAGSFTIVILDADASDEVMAVYSLYAPDGTSLVQATDPIDSPVRTFPSIGYVAVQVPNSPLVAVDSNGEYRFTIYREGAVGSAWVYVIQTLRKEPQFSKMDVNFWFVGTPGLNSTTAKTNQKFQTLVQTFVQVLKGHGITVGNKLYLDVTGAAATKYTYIDTGSAAYEVDEHAELLALSDSLPPSNRGVSFFFVQGFNGWSVLGKAGGIPGPPLVHGTYGSGVAVSLADYYGWSEYAISVTAETMAHELGHQLGLFHTSEQDGLMHDPIPDTPECTDKNGDGLVDYDECYNKDADNLMFWSVTLSAKLTPGQKYVIHRNASLY